MYLGNQTKYDRQIFKHTFDVCKSSKLSNYAEKFLGGLLEALGWRKDDGKKCPVKPYEKNKSITFSDEGFPKVASIFSATKKVGFLYKHHAKFKLLSDKKMKTLVKVEVTGMVDQSDT